MLTTIAGESVEVDESPLETVRELMVLAGQRLDSSDAMVLVFGETVLDKSKTLEESSLYSGASLYVTFPQQAMSFHKTLTSRNVASTSLALEPADGSDDETLNTVARFQSGAEGYRCAVAAPLPESGRQGVIFDFINYDHWGAVDLHNAPEAMLDGPMGNYGWIGETPGGICLYHSGCGICRIRHNEDMLSCGDTDTLADGRNMLRLGASILVEVDHSAKLISWTDISEEGTKLSCALPVSLIGCSLFPVVCFTSGSIAKVQIRFS